MPRTLVWGRAGLGHACQIGNMAILLTLLLFVFEISFLPKYRVNYYDYIIKWCIGIQCNWCASLDMRGRPIRATAVIFERKLRKSANKTQKIERKRWHGARK